ncbi:hypothetical protein RCO48_37465 [Peribacillus frigoritolerans]|nr:hypothetical protein [Peribacillus frigoritolerans]
MIEADVRDSCGKKRQGDPAGESRGGSPTARGKRVPYVPINVQIVQAIKIDKLDFIEFVYSLKPTFQGRFFFNIR